MVVVRDRIRQIGKLCLESGLLATQKSLAECAQLSRIVERAMLQDTLARFLCEIETRKLGVTLFEQIDDSQRL